MNNSLINPEYSPLRAAEEDTAGSASVEDMGLVAGLDKFLEENPDATALENPEEPSSSDSSANSVSEDTPEKAEQKSDSALVQDDELGLPTLGSKPEPVSEEPAQEDQFDEAAFDAATNQEVEGLDPGKGEAWKKLKEELKAYKKGEIQLPELQVKLETLEKENASLKETADEVEAIKARMKSVTSRNAELLLEESQEYQDSVILPHREISKTISALAQAKKINEEDIWEVIGEGDPAKRINMLDELENSIGGRNSLLVQNMANDIRVIAEKDKQMRENAESIVAQAKTIDAKSQQEASSVRASDFKVEAKQAFELHSSKIPGFSDESGMLTDAGRSAQASTTTVDVNSLSVGDLAYMAFATEALPQSLRKIRSLEKENRDLRVAAGDKSSDILPGGTKSKTVDDNIDPDTGNPMGLLEHMAKQTFDSAV